VKSNLFQAKSLQISCIFIFLTLATAMLFKNEYTDFLIFNFHTEVLILNLGLNTPEVNVVVVLSDSLT